MKKSSFIILVSGLLVLAAAVHALRRHSAVTAQAHVEAAILAAPVAPPRQILTAQPVEIKAAAARIATKLPAKSKSRHVALQSLATMTSVMSEFGRNAHSMDDLVRFLDDSKSRPLVAKDVSPYVGEMDLIRTRSPLPGTRFFTAQYSGSGDERVLSQMSFDLEASPTALSEATQSLREAFKVSGEPQMKSKDQVVFDLGNGYLASARKMTWDDLKDSPTNAYGKNDVGTIRVTMQMDQEGD